MSRQRLFTRDMIHQVNQAMIDRKPVDVSGLPISVVQSIQALRFSRSEINQAFAQARRRIAEGF